MKFLINVFIFSFLSLTIFNCDAQSKTDKKVETATFKVWGNCDMCKETIEAALDVKGIKSANWNTETKMIQVSFSPDKMTLEKIHDLIAASGYDTELKKGDDKAYAGLHECCQYKRRK